MQQNETHWTRRAWLGTAAGAVVALISPLGAACAKEAAEGNAAAQAPGVAMHVYKSPTCGCCRDWVDYVNSNGFTATTEDIANVAPIKKQLGMPEALASCHTAVVGSYVIEGHVPARLIHKLIESKDALIAGLAVPGMVTGSPGMEGLTSDPYDVIAYDKQGGTRVYEHIPG